MISNKEDQGGIKRGIKQRVLNVDTRIILKTNVQSGLRRKKSGYKKENRKMGQRKWGRNEKSIMFACLEEEETVPRNEEVPGNGVNVAYSYIYI